MAEMVMWQMSRESITTYYVWRQQGSRYGGKSEHLAHAKQPSESVARNKWCSMAIIMASSGVARLQVRSRPSRSHSRWRTVHSFTCSGACNRNTQLFACVDGVRHRAGPILMAGCFRRCRSKPSGAPPARRPQCAQHGPLPSRLRSDTAAGPTCSGRLRCDVCGGFVHR